MGHLFITRADLTNFECDDWLIPTDRWAKVEPQWWKGREDALRAAGARRPGEPLVEEVFPNNGPRFKPVNVEGLPRAWLGRTGSRQMDVDWYISGATGFIDTVLEKERAGVRNRRARRLIAVPAIGSGKGGGAEYAGKVLDHLVPALASKALDSSADIALVTYNEADFAAAQAIRRVKVTPDPWPELDSEAREHASLISGDAAAGRLILFFGSGLSASSGLPSWKELLRQLMKSAGLDDGEIRAISNWPSLDQAEYVERALRRAGKGLGQEVSTLLENRGHPNLALTFAANLPIEGLITTNYDQLFEDAVTGLGGSLAILPYAPSREARRWLLKMHGSIDHQDDIVLTRRSYNRYAERNQALAGIVQAMLITRRMLFLGFSLSDDNFLRIVDTVRSAVSPNGAELPGAQPLGTALMLRDDPVLERLWANELVLYSPSVDNETNAENSRRMEIFLDYLLFQTSSTKHFLNPRFWGALDDEEQLLADALGELATKRPKKSASAAWVVIQETLLRLGGRQAT